MNYQEIYEKSLRRAGIVMTNGSSSVPGFPSLYENFKAHANSKVYKTPLCFTRSLPQSQFNIFEYEFQSLIRNLEKQKSQHQWEIEREARELQAIRKELLEKKTQKRKELEDEIKVIDEQLGKEMAFQYCTRTQASGSGTGRVYTNWGYFEMRPWLSGDEETFNHLDVLEAKIQDYKKMYAEVQKFREDSVPIVEDQVKNQFQLLWAMTDEQLLQRLRETGGSTAQWALGTCPYQTEENTSPTYWKQLVLSEIWGQKFREEAGKFRLYCELLYARNKDTPLLSNATARIQELEGQNRLKQTKIEELELKLTILYDAFRKI
jgi:hypothetical protein